MSYYQKDPEYETAKIIKDLYKQGYYDEAVDRAVRFTRKYSGSITALRTLFWALYWRCKNNLEQGRNTELINSDLGKMKNLGDDVLDWDETSTKCYNNLATRALLLSDPQGNLIAQNDDLSRSKPIEAYQNVVNSLGYNELKEELHERFGWIIYRYLNAILQNPESDGREIRTTFLKYINLNNERPSQLHSQMLWLALKAADKFQRFDKFVEMWGVGNFRKPYEDEGKDLDKLLPHLITKLMEKTPPQDIVALFETATDDVKSRINESIAKAYYLRLLDLRKSHNYSQLWPTYNEYLAHCPRRCNSTYHSRILGEATYAMTEQNRWRLLPFARQWGIENLATIDFRQQPNTKNPDQPFDGPAVRVAKACYEHLKMQQHRETTDLEWLASLLDLTITNCPNDKWMKYYRALVASWLNQRDDALNRYKDLLCNTDLSAQYYVWKNAADMTDDLNLKLGLLLKAHSLDASKVRDLLEKAWNQAGVTTDQQRRDATPALEQRAMQEVYSEMPSQQFVMMESYTNAQGKKRILFIAPDGTTVRAIPAKFPACRKIAPGDIVTIIYRTEKAQSGTTFTQPLCISPTSTAPWSILPLVYAFINRVFDKNYHVVTQCNDNHSLNIPLNKVKQQLNEGDFVTLRLVTINERSYCGQVTPCDAQEALKHFYNMESTVTRIDDKGGVHLETTQHYKLRASAQLFATPPTRGDKFIVKYALWKSNKTHDVIRRALSVTPKGNTTKS